jgi:hypothetical protein
MPEFNVEKMYEMPKVGNIATEIDGSTTNAMRQNLGALL